MVNYSRGRRYAEVTSYLVTNWNEPIQNEMYMEQDYWMNGMVLCDRGRIQSP